MTTFPESSSLFRIALSKIILSTCVALPCVFLGLILQAYSGTAVEFSHQWVPSLDINLVFRLDGLSVLFASLITGVGVLVQLYASAYMSYSPKRISFHVYLSLFMLSMLGLVLADNLLLLFVFWELTTLTSYLLIGFDYDKPVARKNALQAMLLSAAGGLVMLAGLIMLGEMADTYSLHAITQSPAPLLQHPWFIPSMLCILMGCFTKSAQWPFHFWLPGAMAAPTPVSAYLHSSTMVKAGVYLLARMLPVYGQHELWQVLLCSFGAFTALWCALLAYKQTDLKLMLAYSTNVILGQLVLLIGIGSSYAVTAALLLIAAHSFYKAGLFMIVGNIDKATGTREYYDLAGLKSVLAISFSAAVITGASKAGLPPSFGFISKEYIYKAGLEFGWLLAAAMLLVNAIMVALSLLILIKPFLQKSHAKSAAMQPVENQRLLWLPPVILAVLSAVVPIALLSFYQGLIITPAATAMLNSTDIKTVKLWTGFNLPLLLSGVTFLIGVFLYKAYPVLNPKVNRFVAFFGTGKDHFQGLIDATVILAKQLTRTIQHGQLSAYTLQFFFILALILLVGISHIDQLPAVSIKVDYYELILAAFLVASAFVVVKSETLLLSVAALGTMGFLTTLVFLTYSAPDVAKTQLLVETLIVVFIAIALRYLPRSRAVPKHSRTRRGVNAIIASLVGLAVGLVLWLISAAPLDPQLSQFYALNSVSGGHGRNIVNVILVDFRAFDTLGEAVVVIVAALAAIAALGRIKADKLEPREGEP